MDGCWAFWEKGCAIDWQAWSAVGTFAAVFAALLIAFVEIRTRKRAEVQEARIVASMLGHEYLAVGTRLAGILHDLMSAEPTATTFAVALNHNSAFRTSALRRMTNSANLPRTEAALPRLHVLPESVAGEILHAVQTTKLLMLGTVPYGQAFDRGDSAGTDEAAHDLFDSLMHTLNALSSAADACNALGDELAPTKCSDDH